MMIGSATVKKMLVGIESGFCRSTKEWKSVDVPRPISW
jgi:hypothetical protein